MGCILDDGVWVCWSDIFIMKLWHNIVELIHYEKVKWKILLNGGNIENTFCNKEDKALPLQIQIYIVVTIHSNILLICTYFINIYACITIIGAEKRRRTSPCETHPFVDSALPHTQSTPLSESTLTVNQKQQDFTGQFETRPKKFVNSRTINASSIQRNKLYFTLIIVQ